MAADEGASGPAAGSAEEAPPATEGTAPPLEDRHVLFRSGGQRFALPLEAVREVVVPAPPYARVPRAGAAVRGAMNLRGRVVAVVELAPLLGLPRDALGPAQGHLLLLDRGRRGLALLVEGVLGVERIPARAAGATAEVGGAAVRVLDGDALETLAAALFQPP